MKYSEHRYIQSKKMALLLLSVQIVMGGVLCAPVPAFGQGNVAGAEEMVAPEEVGKEGVPAIPAGDVPKGEYEVEAESSSSMFRITEATLFADDNRLKVQLVMGGKGYLYVFPGSAEAAAAAAEGEYIPYEENEDGDHTFTVPVPALNEPFALAAYSKKKEKWYDRQIVVYAPAVIENKGLKPAGIDAADGTYELEVSLDGGSGKAAATSPATIEIRDKKATLYLEWSSPNYDYMYVNGRQYLPTRPEGANSVFEIPVYAFDEWTDVLADTTAMSRPHEIRYRLLLKTSTMKKKSGGIKPAAILALALLSVGTVAGVAGVTASVIIRRGKSKVGSK